MSVVRVDYHPTSSKKNGLFSIDIDKVNILFSVDTLAKITVFIAF